MMFILTLGKTQNLICDLMMPDSEQLDAVVLLLLVVVVLLVVIELEQKLVLVEEN